MVSLKKKAITILEVSIALVLLGTVTGSLMLIFSQGSKNYIDSKEMTIAQNLAREKIEELFITDAALFSSPSSYNETRAVVTGYAGIERQVVVTSPYAGVSWKPFAKIEVTVWWDGGRKSQVISTLKAHY